MVEGVCERCGSPVIRKEKSQWMLKITAYAQRLIDDLISRFPKDVVNTDAVAMHRSLTCFYRYLIQIMPFYQNLANCIYFF